MEAREFFQSQMDPCVCYKEVMVLIFYVDYCLICSPSKDKIDEVYAYLQAYLKIEYGVNIKNYLGIEMYHRPDVSIHMRQPYITQIFPNMITSMEKSSAKPTPAVKPPLAKNEGSHAGKNDFNYRSVIGSLNFLTNSTLHEAQFLVYQFARFSADPKLPHNQAVKRVIKYLNGSSDQ